LVGASSEGARRRFEQRIARRAAVAVVEAAKPFEVDRDQQTRLPFGRLVAPFELVRDRFGKRAAVQQFGQQIVRFGESDPFGQGLFARGIEFDRDIVGGCAGVVAHRCDHRRCDVGFAVLAAVDQFTLPGFATRERIP